VNLNHDQRLRCGRVWPCHSRYVSTRRALLKSMPKLHFGRFSCRCNDPGEIRGLNRRGTKKREAACAASREGGVRFTPFSRSAGANRKTFTVAACLRQCEGGHKPQTQSPPPTFLSISCLFLLNGTLVPVVFNRSKDRLT